MNLKSGSVYFIAERETLIPNTTRTPFVKIGLVKDGDNREVLSRLSEHQTGNPRELFILAEVSTYAVTEVENIMHNLLAPKRVQGEWFQLDQTEADSALAKATKISTLIKDSLPTLKEAEAFASVLSSGLNLLPSEEALKWHRHYLEQAKIIKYVSSAINQIKTAFKAAAVVHTLPTEVAQVKPVKTFLRFDVDGFRAAYPEIAKKFEFPTVKMKCIFKVNPKPTSSEPLAEVDNQIKVLVEKVNEIFSTDLDQSDLKALHRIHAELMGYKSMAELNQSLAAAHLKVICGEATSIKDVCTWSRKNETKIMLDEKGLLENHQDIFKDFLVESVENSSLRISRKYRKGQK